jgi:hypothetical protein
MSYDTFSCMEVLKEVLSCFFICIIRDDFERNQRFLIVMGDFRKSCTFHIDELSSFCLESFTSTSRSDELIAGHEYTGLELRMFYHEQVKEWIESFLCFVVTLDETIMFDGMFDDYYIAKLEMR